MAGAAPALIQSGPVHPTDSLAGSGVTLEAMLLGGWPGALANVLPPSIELIAAGAPATAPPIRVRLRSPHGLTTLESPRFGS